MHNQNQPISRRAFLQLSAGVLGAASLAACVAPVSPATQPAGDGQAATPDVAKTKVLWWRSQGGTVGELLDRFAADFNASSSTVEVQAEFQGGYVEHLEKLIASAAAGALPDMILIGDGQYPPLARAGLLLGLNDLLTNSTAIDASDYKEPINRGIMDGEMYQLVYGVSTPIYYMNAEMLDEAGLSGAPETWEQAFTEYFPKLTKGDVSSFVYLVSNWWQQSAVWSAGAMVNDDNWEVDLANPAVVDWFEQMQSARKSGQCYVPTAADGTPAAYFGSGKGAMMIESTGVIGSVDEVTGGKFTTICGYLPSGVGGRWVPSGGNGLSIMAGVSEPVRDASWEFISYLHETNNYAEYVKLTGYIPITTGTEAALAEVIAADPRRQVAIDQLAFSRWHMRIHTIARAAQEMWNAWTEIVQTDIDVAQRLQQLQNDVVAIVREEGIEPTLPA
ncbi:MAG: ABC transporter substrate-binding protein [Chloroflexota bacterium]|nr:MAG: ABC transporter substrate-binding protein [Chloroflexota bacterium]